MPSGSRAVMNGPQRWGAKESGGRQRACAIGISGWSAMALLNSSMESVPESSVSILTNMLRSSSSLPGGVEKAITWLGSGLGSGLGLGSGRGPV